MIKVRANWLKLAAIVKPHNCSLTRNLLRKQRDARKKILDKRPHLVGLGKMHRVYKDLAMVIVISQ